MIMLFKCCNVGAMPSFYLNSMTVIRLLNTITTHSIQACVFMTAMSTPDSPTSQYLALQKVLRVICQTVAFILKLSDTQFNLEVSYLSYCNRLIGANSADCQVPRRLRCSTRSLHGAASAQATATSATNQTSLIHAAASSSRTPLCLSTFTKPHTTQLVF